MSEKAFLNVPLGSVVSISKGKLTVQTDFKVKGYLPIINTDAVRGNITYYGDPKGALVCSKDEVLMLWDGERSGLVATNMNGIVGSTFAKLSTNGLIESKYLFYFLTNQFEWIQGNRTGTGVPHVPKDLHRILFINYPEDKKEQQRISKILSICDAVIEKTQAAIAKYKAIKKGMLHDLFTRGIDIDTGKLRPKYEDAPELYKESKLGMVPSDWEVCELGKYIVDNLYGPRFSARDYSENGNVRTIRGTDFSKDGEILYSQAPKALLPSVLVNTHKLEKGDVVIVTTADCGLTAIFNKPKNEVDFIPSAYSVKYRFAKNINPYFIKYFMATYSSIKQVNKFVRQGTLGNLPGSDVLRFDMAYPKTEEQNEIAKKLKTVDSKLQSEQNYLRKQQAIKQGLMGDLLSGRRSVNVDSAVNEPADAITNNGII